MNIPAVSHREIVQVEVHALPCLRRSGGVNLTVFFVVGQGTRVNEDGVDVVHGVGQVVDLLAIKLLPAIAKEKKHMMDEIGMGAKDSIGGICDGRHIRSCA